LEKISTIATELNEPVTCLIRPMGTGNQTPELYPFSGGEGAGSDIHIEPYEREGCAFRIDGILYKIPPPKVVRSNYFPGQDHGRPEHCRKGHQDGRIRQLSLRDGRDIRVS
jgi:hypothetical protein